MLRGKDLIELVEKVHTKLLVVGAKSVNVEDSAKKAQELLQVKENYKDVCCKERVSRLESRMIGQYDPKRRVVTVKRLIGSSHRLYGHSDKNGTHFELYEALYLMEIDDLLIYYDDVIVSVEQAYVLFLASNEMGFEQYVTYKTLLQSGLVVLKHKKLHSIDAETEEDNDSLSADTSHQSQFLITRNDQIWDYLRSKVHFLNWKQIRCENTDVDEDIAVKFGQTCTGIQSKSSVEGPQLKKQKFERQPFPERHETGGDTNFLNVNEKYGFEKIFSQLDQIGTVSDEDRQTLISNELLMFDFDIYYAEDAKKRKLSQNNRCTPNFYGKVIKFESQIDYSLINALKIQARSIPVMLIIVFENLTISSFIC